jgi:hypothetical protein
MKKLALIVLALLAAPPVCAQESWLIPIGDPVYQEAEELFLNEGVVPPYEELPLAAEELKTRLAQLAGKSSDPQKKTEIQSLNDRLKLIFGAFTPITAFAFAAYFNDETDRFRSVTLYDGRSPEGPPPANQHDGLDSILRVYNYLPFYESSALPSLLTAGFIVQFAGFALQATANLRQTNYGLLQDYNFTTVPLGFDKIDFANLPVTGVLNFYSPYFQAQIGRGKLSTGPGKWSTLSLNGDMPYYDHVRARVRYEGFSLSCTVVSLNADISSMESDYLDYLYASNQNPEPNATDNGRIYRDRIKTYISDNLVFRPWDWLSFSITQTNLIGGRPIDIADFNPLIILHNNYDDGTYSVPLLCSATVVPLKGVKLYAEFMLYDLIAGSESEYSDTNPGAIGLMAGLTLLSTPYFDAGPGRFRFDFEFAYVDPFAYGKYYDLRKFTSRFTYVDPGAGRYWVDYPFGFYLGPDCVDFHALLSYGRPADWEVGLEWETTGQGSINLYGYGDDGDYRIGVNAGSAPSGTAQWTHAIKALFSFTPLPNLRIRLWYRLTFVNNRFDPVARQNVPGDNYVFNSLGAAATWKLF